MMERERTDLENTIRNNDRMTVKFGRHLLNRIRDISKKRGFDNPSQFIKYAIRKELDYQSELEYMPDVKRLI